MLIGPGDGQHPKNKNNSTNQLAIILIVHNKFKCDENDCAMIICVDSLFHSFIVMSSGNCWFMHWG